MMPVAESRHRAIRYVVSSTTERVRQITGGQGEGEEVTGGLDRGAGPRSLSEIANSGPSEGGSFVYDEATLQSLVTKWVELAEHYQGSVNRIDLGSVVGPGEDFASRALADSANNSGMAYRKYLVQNYWYCIEQAQQLQHTLDDYLGVEHRSVIDFTNAVEPEPTQGGPRAGI
jgi:hypothetical protein